MRIKIGSRFDLLLSQPTPMIALLNVHDSRIGDLETDDLIQTSPQVPMTRYRDAFGNVCTRLVAPAGLFTIGTNAVVYDTGKVDAYAPDADQHAVEDLPDEVIQFLLGSRYCDTDLLSDIAWQLFQNTPTGWGRVQAICDFVHSHIRFDYQQARATRSASQAYYEQVGVCRDFTHLAIAFCRCMNIPARYCNGYLGDIGRPPPYAPGDFSAWLEVYLGGQWWTFDARNNVPRIGRVLVARGRDAADIPMIQSFGINTLTGFEVWTDEIPDTANEAAA